MDEVVPPSTVWARNNPEKVHISRTRWRKKRAAELVALKDLPCVKCHQKLPPECMDWHHRDPGEKKFGLAAAGNRRMELVLQETEKCDLICANCHRIETYGAEKEGECP